MFHFLLCRPEFLSGVCSYSSAGLLAISALSGFMPVKVFISPSSFKRYFLWV